MRLYSKHFIFLCFFLKSISAFSQVQINFSVKPPFTPFLSDYTNPERLTEVSISLFNQTTSVQNLKFKLTLQNSQKGISIVLKDDVVPTAALVLQPNEFKFIVLEEISGLYSGLNANNFAITGINVQNLLLDGTIPDGNYEVCLQAFDFDAPLFSKPLSNNSPLGCFNFSVNYIDPPTDIRLNQNLLQYSFGGAIPVIPINGLVGQNYTIQFTPPALNLGSQYEYELKIFDQTMINPAAQQERTINEALNSLIPIISKISSAPFFQIEPSDMELDAGKNYFMVIIATDLNSKAKFKNNGISAWKAFRLLDIQPIALPAPTFEEKQMLVTRFNIPDKIIWDNNFPTDLDPRMPSVINTRIKIVKVLSTVPSYNIFTNSNAVVIYDTVFTYFEGNKVYDLFSSYDLKKISENRGFKIIFGVKHSIRYDQPNTQHLRFLNNGEAQKEFMFSAFQNASPANTFSQIYPLNNDTLPFQFPPVVVTIRNLDETDAYVLTEMNGGLEMSKNYNYLRRTQNERNNNTISEFAVDSNYRRVAELIDRAGEIQLLGGDDDEFMVLMARAAEIMNRVNNQSLIRINDAEGGSIFPIGSNALGKMAIGKSLVDVQASNQFLGLDQYAAAWPNIAKILYFLPYKNDIKWNCRIGVYNMGGPNNLNMNFSTFEEKFRNNSFTTQDLSQHLLFNKFVNYSGSINVGMKTPLLDQRLDGKTFYTKEIEIKFRPSAMPQQLFPSAMEKTEIWKNNKFQTVSQQWNIEISKNKNFVVLDTVVSKPIEKVYDLETDRNQILDDLYNSVSQTVRVKNAGKYYYRITWSNAVRDINEPGSKDSNYRKQMDALLVSSMLFGESGNLDSMLFMRHNYKFSAIDSFVVSDTIIAKVSDTAICGRSCNYVLAGNENVAAQPIVLNNDVLKIGLFDLNLKAIRKSGNNYSGEGLITTKLFGAPILVEFTDVSLNANKRIISGVVRATRKTSDILGDLASNINQPLITKFAEGANNTVKARANYALFNSPACLLLNSLVRNEITMPFGLSKEVDNFPYTIAITDIDFTPTNAVFNVGCVLKLSVLNDEDLLSFAARNLCLTPDGIANISNGGLLTLIGDYRIPISSTADITFIGERSDGTNTLNRGTHILWDCKGFKQLNVHADFTVDTSIAYRGFINITKRKLAFTANGFATINSLNNFLIEFTSEDSLQFSCAPDITIKGSKWVFDNNSLINSPNMTFPAGYRGSNGPDWKGVFLNNVELVLPKYLASHLPGRMKVIGSNFLLDQSGFSGVVRASNVVSSGHGKIAGWKYSISSLNFAILQNAPQDITIAGDIEIPGLKKMIGYSAAFSTNGNDSMPLQFSLAANENIEFPAIIGKIGMQSSSTISIMGKFRDPNTLTIVSNINGTITLGANEFAGFKDITFGTLPFEGLKIISPLRDINKTRFSLDKLGGQNMNRRIENSAISSNGNSSNSGSGASSSPSSTPTSLFSDPNQKVGGFPIQVLDFASDSINGKCLFDLNPSMSGARYGLSFKVKLNLIQLGTAGFGGECKMGLYGKFDIQGVSIDFKPAGINIDTIKVEFILNGACSIKGAIAFLSNDPVYGNGVAGMVEADIAQVLKVKVSGMFGSVKSVRYWMFGAQLTLPVAIPIDFSLNVIYAKSFSGELWYNMNRQSGSAASASAGSQLGVSPTGAKFVPSDSLKFGLAAGLTLTGPQGSPLFGEVVLGAEIALTGGLSKSFLEGNLWLTEFDKSKATVFVRGVITIDVSNAKLVGSLEALVNVGNGAVRGIQPIISNNLTFYSAGVVDFLMDFRNQEWYIKMGNPYEINRRLGLAIYVNNSELFRVDAYFLMGNKLPKNTPPLSQAVVSGFALANLSIDKSLPSSNASGFRIYTGISGGIKDQRVQNGVFYAGLSFSMGIDAALAPYNLCPSRNGIGNYYANGTAYAILNATIGIEVETPFYKGSINFADINAAAKLNAGFANPYYFDGNLQANYSVLGGLISGRANLAFSIKEDKNCGGRENKNSLRFNQLVSNSTLKNGEKNIIVGVEPQIEMSYALNKETEFVAGAYYDAKNQRIDSIRRKVRMVMNSVTLIEKISKKPKSIKTKISDDGLDLTITPDSFLSAANTAYVLRARFTMQMLTNRSWLNVVSGGKTFDTTVIIDFVTEEFATMRPEDISYSTPLAGENYFKIGDCPSVSPGFPRGRIVFKQGGIQNTFFEGGLPVSGLARQTALDYGYNRYYAMLVVSGKPRDTLRMPIAVSNALVGFTLPNTLKPGELYSVRIIRERVGGIKTSLAGLEFGRNSTISDLMRNDQSSPNFRSNKLSTIKGDRRTILYTFVFEVSKYNKMNDKAAQLRMANSRYIFSSLKADTLKLNTTEPFEEYEINGFRNNNVSLSPHISFSSAMVRSEFNNWIKDFYLPKMHAPVQLLNPKLPNTERRNFDNQFALGNNITIADNFHIMPTIESTYIQTYDFRIADNMLLNLKHFNKSLQLSSFKINGLGFATNASASNNTSNTANIIEFGDQLHLVYNSVYNVQSQQFDYLKAISAFLVRPPYWNTLNQAEKNAVTNARNLSFVRPTLPNPFYFSVPASTSINNSVKFNFNDNIQTMLLVEMTTPTPTTTTTKTTSANTKTSATTKTTTTDLNTNFTFNAFTK